MINMCYTKIPTTLYILINETYRQERKPSHTTTKLTLFAVSKDELYKKENSGKFMKNALYILRYTKRHLQAKALLNSGKVKPVYSISHC